ncbi:hypothetical protein GO986_02750 [Deinococcus sp. HMF7620]|uniref:Phage tail assembly protein n=1 Tax=Deinococcus arboris TaxID=2682977 RepID=A0A7C9LJ70_9DEIO|nr:hypothetical protein [Deinococcus arboris]
MNELPFMLPVGLFTSDGQVHRSGVMRLATALDEIEPLGDARVQQNEAYYSLLLLARVVTRLGPFSPVTPEVLAVLPAADFAHLQALYAHLNTVHPVSWSAPTPTVLPTDNTLETECPHCGALLELDLTQELSPA